MVILLAVILGLIISALVAAVISVCEGPVEWTTFNVYLKHFLVSCKDSLHSISSLGTLVTVVFIGVTALIAWRQVRLTGDVAVVDQKSRLEYYYAELTDKLDPKVKDYLFNEHLPDDHPKREDILYAAKKFHIGIVRLFLIVHECDKKKLLSKEDRAHWKNGAKSWFQTKPFIQHWERVKNEYPKSFQNFMESCKPR